jgi:hypothetical protein
MKNVGLTCENRLFTRKEFQKNISEKNFKGGVAMNSVAILAEKCGKKY